jgi:hypothetical protein
MIRVRTYLVPGEFYEANPGSSARYIGTFDSTSKLVRPRMCIFKGSRCQNW